jgi:hypothetical protein
MWGAVGEIARAIRMSVGSWSRTARCAILVLTVSLAIVGTTAGVAWSISLLR